MKKNLRFRAIGWSGCLALLISNASLGQKIDSATLSRNLRTVTHLSTPAPASAAAQKPATAIPLTLVSSEVRVFPSSNPQSEIHLSINKTNPLMLLLSSNTLVPTSDQGAWWSTNGGSSWLGAETLPNNSAGRNDPSTGFDANGTGYLSTLTPTPGNLPGEPISYSIQKVTNDGETWTNQVQGTGTITIDKPMIGIDDVSSSPYANNFYCAWMGANNVVQFNKSINQGVNFSAPVNLTNYWGQGTNVQTGPGGQVYICWADYNGNNIANNWTSNGMDFCTSTNGGVTFTPVARVLTYTGIRQFNPTTGDDENPNFNMTRVNDFPTMAVDKSTGTHRGRIYVTLAEKQNGNGKAIIQVSSSDNQGVTWSAPVTVSIANALQAWFPWISTDASTGLVYVVYYAFDQSSGYSTNTYVATSIDGGVTFSNQKVSSVAHTTAVISPYSGGYAGDYIGIDAYALKAYPAWMDNRTGQWQDYVVKLDNTPVITGLPAFCTSATYTVSNLLPGTTVTWSATPPTGVISLAPNGNQVTATRLAQGNATLYATVNQFPNAAGSFNLTTIPQISAIQYYMSGGCTSGIQSWYADATPNMPTATNWHWTVNNPNSGIYILNASSPSTFMDVSKGGGVSVTYVDGCGETSLVNGMTIYNPCGPGAAFLISPNPASTAINISATPGAASPNTTTGSNSQINIYNFQNILQKHLVLADVNGARIDISGLPVGLYVVEIIQGDNKEIHKLQILR